MTKVSIDIVRKALHALHAEIIAARMEGRSGVVEDATKAAKEALDHLLLVQFAYGNK